MRAKRTPPLMGTYSVAMHDAVRIANKDGSFIILFDSPKQAMGKKFEFYRFFHSANYYNPDSELAYRCNSLKIRINGAMLELLTKEAEPSNQAIEKAVKDRADGLKRQAGLDPVADRVRAFDDDFEQLRQAEVEGKLPGSKQD